MPQLKIRDSSIIEEGRNGYWQTVGSFYHKEFIQILEDVNIWTNQDIEMQLFWYIWCVLNKAAKIFFLKTFYVTLLLRTCHGLSNSLKILTVSGKDSCYLYPLRGLSALIPTTFPLIHPFSLLLTPAGYTHLRAFSLLDIVRLTPYHFCVFV